MVSSGHITAPPPSVHLTFAQSSLTQLESNSVNCSAIGLESSEPFNLTLWRNDQLLAQVSGDYLSYRTPPHSYGTYTCVVDGLQDSAVLQEKGTYNYPLYCHAYNIILTIVQFQLLFDDLHVPCYQLLVRL